MQVKVHHRMLFLVQGKKVNNIIFTGLPRTPEIMKRNLSGFSKLQNQKIVNKIVFSTWTNYMTPAYWNLMNKYNVIVLEKEEPEDKGRGGHCFCQAKALENGLDVCNPQDKILKLRTDTWLDADFIGKIMTDDSYLDKEPDDIFIKKVWVPYAEITKPFYMPDEMFYGYHSDIYKLVNYEKFYDSMVSKDGGGETHIRRFIHPFLFEYPIFNDMIEEIANDNFVRLFSKDRFELLKTRLTESKYLTYLANYYYILYKYFRIYNTGQMEWYQPYCKPKISLDNDKFTENFTRLRSFCEQRIFCYDDKWIANVVEGKLNFDKTAKMIYNIIEGL